MRFIAPAHCRTTSPTYLLLTRALSRTRDAIGARHLGTLGGGNHFVELDRDGDGDSYLVHSGSRGIGAAIPSTIVPSARCSRSTATKARTTSATSTSRSRSRPRIAAAFSPAPSRCSTPKAATVIDVHHNHVARDGELFIHRKGAIAGAGRGGSAGLHPPALRGFKKVHARASSPFQHKKQRFHVALVGRPRIAQRRGDHLADDAFHLPGHRLAVALRIELDRRPETHLDVDRPFAEYAHRCGTRSLSPIQAASGRCSRPIGMPCMRDR